MFRERNKVKDSVFEEELVSIPKSIHTVVPTPIQDKIVFPKEQTQHPQELMPLRRFTRERRTTILDDLMIFFWEHEENYGVLKEDPISFHQAMESSYSHRLIVFRETFSLVLLKLF